MSDFLDWHPASENAKKLYDNRANLQDLIYKNPMVGINTLRKKWNFGKISEIWDDFIFENCVRVVLDRNDKAFFKESVCRYSVLDHALFIPYVRREENPVRFRRAFWNINTYGIRIAQRFEQLNQQANTCMSGHSHESSRKKIAFVLKDPISSLMLNFYTAF